ncbi:uncharacterized protein LOC131299672 [Rhododendron vialii]|uniref:uncharacterized protein LOC131299672 n=1 Tax=Rhododendron vialii TaxID=182163 RepID=UPI00265EA68C|nr:uncharacterized protein LOC131299672 [Rhododendron vialii]
MQPVKDQPSHISAWVKLRDLPLELWNQECLSRVASTIGKPLHVDQTTTKTSRQPGLHQTTSTSARICIEISVVHELPKEVRITVEGESVVVPIEYQVLPQMCKLCQVFGHSTAHCSKKLPPTTSPINQEWTIVSNGKPKNNTTQTCSTSSTSPGSPKHAADPQVELTDLEDEFKKVRESIVSSSKETLILFQDEMPIPQLSRTVSSPHCPSTSLPHEINEEAANTSKDSVSLSQLTPVHNGSLQEVDGKNKEISSFGQQADSPNSAAPIARLAAKKAAKIAAKLKVQEPLDPCAISDIKLKMGGSNKAAQLGKQKNFAKGSSHKSGK